MTKPTANPLPALVEGFFAQHLTHERQLSLCTVASYRDTFRLLLAYVQDRTGREPAHQRLKDWEAPHILAFLDHLEKQRHCCVRSRNTRLAAIHCFRQAWTLRPLRCGLDMNAQAPLTNTLRPTSKGKRNPSPALNSPKANQLPSTPETRSLLSWRRYNYVESNADERPVLQALLTSTPHNLELHIKP